MNIKSIIRLFCSLLSDRLKAGTHNTEDSVRFTFFAAMLKEGINPSDVILEYPHPNLNRKKIDTWIAPKRGDKGLAIEFKYNRAGNDNQQRTKHAGKALHDLHRMSQIPLGMHRLLIYLTDAEMAGYFSNIENGLSDFFSGKLECIGPQDLVGRADTLIKAAALEAPIKINTLCKETLHDKHELRVWEVV
jgi:hypothetical protein